MSDQTGSDRPERSDKDLIDAARREAEAMAGSGSSDVGLGLAADVPAGYEVVREIHRGGQGAVFLAIQLATRRKVAIKVMHAGPTLGSAGRARFEREVQILGHLNHANIVKIHDSGQTGSGLCYYVMDYVPGRSLDEHLKANPRMSTREGLDLFAKICDAVNAAHVRGVIHRDLKPANVRINPDGEPIVVDFGLAKIAVGDDDSGPDAMTMTGQFIGSLPWASPEQAGASPEAVDVRTDVYSLGVMLYQLLTHGKFPYDVVANMRQVLDNILHAEPARPSTSERGINDELDTIVLKCLAKDKDRRYQSAGELARDLRHYLNGEPIEAKRDSGLYVITKTLRRYRPQVAVAAGFLLLLVGFVIALSVLLAEASEQRRAAERNFEAARGLARTFMFDFHDEIAPLRGSTRAREMILAEALAYLRGVRADARRDPAFMRELAAAHERVGDLLSGFDGSGTGDAELAAERYEEARRIRQALLDASPGDAGAIADMARSDERRAWIRRQAGDLEEARSALDEAAARYDRAISLAGADAGPWRDARARLGTSVANVLVNRVLVDGVDGEALIDEALGGLEATADHFRTRVDGAPDDADAQRHLAEALRQRCLAQIVGGRLHNGAGDGVRESDPARALAEYEEGVAWFRRAERTAAATRVEIETLLESDPASAPLRRHLSLAWHDEADALRWRGIAHEKAAGLLGDDEARERRESARGLHTEALRLARSALGVAEAMAASDESDAVALADVAVCLNKVGNLRLALGRLDEAEDAYRRSLAIRQSIQASDPSGFNTRRVALAEFKLGDLAMALADDDPADALDDLERAKGRYLRSLRLFESIDDGASERAGGRAVGVVERRLEACRARIRTLRDGGG